MEPQNLMWWFFPWTCVTPPVTKAASNLFWTSLGSWMSSSTMLGGVREEDGSTSILMWTWTYSNSMSSLLLASQGMNIKYRLHECFVNVVIMFQDCSAPYAGEQEWQHCCDLQHCWQGWCPLLWNIHWLKTCHSWIFWIIENRKGRMYYVNHATSVTLKFYFVRWGMGLKFVCFALAQHFLTY